MTHSPPSRDAAGTASFCTTCCGAKKPDGTCLLCEHTSHGAENAFCLICGLWVSRSCTDHEAHAAEHIAKGDTVTLEPKICDRCGVWLLVPSPGGRAAFMHHNTNDCQQRLGFHAKCRKCEAVIATPRGRATAFRNHKCGSK